MCSKPQIDKEPRICQLPLSNIPPYTWVFNHKHLRVYSLLGAELKVMFISMIRSNIANNLVDTSSPALRILG